MSITTNLAKGVFVYSAKENKKEKRKPSLNQRKLRKTVKHIKQKYSHARGERIARVPGEKPYVTSDKLPDSPSKFPCIQL